ncbi:hypothetical protein [Lentzea nigeriaca]|uniref:hypothetical protein n=1 Tax=Lentzea nigeriaca TaxID=1128665 RepID=UPI001958556E|nr:hypothetical protein [Lentzea nigeriaca]MBM7861523.1 hypothetical protein [Lentzea nigeriaca]
MARTRKRRVARKPAATEEAYFMPPRADSSKDRRESAFKFILTATPAALSFLTASLAALADISAFSRVVSLLDFIPVLAGSIGVVSIAATTLYFRSSRTRKPRAEERLELADIPDPGVREIIGSAAREQAFLDAYPAEAQKPPTPGGGR